MWVKKNFQGLVVDTISFGSGDPNSLSARSSRISSSNVVLSTKFLNNSIYFVYAELNDLPLNIVPVINTNELPDYSRWQCWANNSDYFYVSYYSIGEIYRVRVSDAHTSFSVLNIMPIGSKPLMHHQMANTWWQNVWINSMFLNLMAALHRQQVWGTAFNS